MNDILSEMSQVPADGIELCDDKCACGGTLRLHAYTFSRCSPSHKKRYYIDCDRHCGKVGDWADTIDEALASYDGVTA